MKIILFGATGYLGSWIHEYFLGPPSPLTRGWKIVPIKTDVTDLEQVRKALKGIGGQVVINATGKTGSPNVDWCETHRLETASVNITGAINVAKVASEQGNFVVQMGSGCVFQGTPDPLTPLQGGTIPPLSRGLGGQGWSESDAPNFFGSFYSQTKAIAEGALKEIPNVAILRIRMPLSSRPHPKNLLTKLLQYKKILNAPNSVTLIEDLMPFIEKIIERRVEIEALPNRIFNAVNPGVYHHRDLLELYQKNVDPLRRTGPSRPFEYITPDQFAGMTKAARSNCVLSTKKSEKLGIAMPSIGNRLESLVRGYLTSP